MRRRTFIVGLGGAAAWPMVARAQQPGTPVIGFLSSGQPELNARQLDAFRSGLNEMGFNEGHNLFIEYRWAAGHHDRLPALATELVKRQVAVIASTGGNVTALAAKAATRSIPIVFTMGDDPVRLGLVPSLSQPDGNLTGASFYTAALAGKRLELLRELLPRVSTVGFLFDPDDPVAITQLKDVQFAAQALGQQLVPFEARSQKDIEATFLKLSHEPSALLVGSNPFLYERLYEIVALAARYKIPACYFEREFSAAGGLVSYGAVRSEAYRQAGIYVGRILKGAKPADLPVTQPTKFELVLNLKTAKALGVEISPILLARADEVIE